MARQLRVQFPGALYHVINRGNYRHDVFAAQGAITALERTLAQTCERHGWRLHAYVIMRNHFRLALETPPARCRRFT
jgi:putative transposase